MKVSANTSRRSRHGNMLSLTVSVFVTVILALTFFGLNYTRFLASHEEQRSAIEAASLKAAEDIGKIVIEDPNFGFVSLSDYAPIGTATKAEDGFFMPVQSINTVFGTVRLDLIVADYLQDPIMTELARNDYYFALAAKDHLLATLESAIQAGGVGRDINGKSVNPSADAQAAYLQNLVRLTGDKATLSPGSLKLTLGCVAPSSSSIGALSNVPLPLPISCADVPAINQREGCYVPDVNIPYDGLNFVFAALGNSVGLVDHKKFVTVLPNLPFLIPSVVRCAADERFYDQKSMNFRVVHEVAAAQACSIRDPRPAPGAFTVSFNSGPIPELQHVSDLFTNSQLVYAPCDTVQTSGAGDYPPSALTSLPISTRQISDKTRPLLGEALSIAFYSWLRRAGTNANVGNIVQMMRTPFDGGAVQQYQVTPGGLVSFTSSGARRTNLCISQNQWRAISGLAFKSSNKNVYDVQITDYVYKEGRINGGRHAGEPLAQPFSKNSFAVAAFPSFYPIPNWPFTVFAEGPPGGAVRPTYDRMGLAVDVTFRLRTP